MQLKAPEWPLISNLSDVCCYEVDSDREGELKFDLQVKLLVSNVEILRFYQVFLVHLKGPHLCFVLAICNKSHALKPFYNRLLIWRLTETKCSLLSKEK